MGFIQFAIGSLRIVTRGPKLYWAWIALLLLMILIGFLGYSYQIDSGMIVTNMRDQVSWGFYIGNFTFLVGVAAAAVMLVIPAYVYNWKPIKEIAILGELLAISAIIMCLLFVTVDIGRPDRAWHLMPVIGKLNFPTSLLAWDVLVLNLYFLLNLGVVTYILYCHFMRRAYNKSIVIPLVLFSIPAAVAIHTVTAFLFNGIPGRPFWNASIRFCRVLAGVRPSRYWYAIPRWSRCSLSTARWSVNCEKTSDLWRFSSNSSTSSPKT